MKESWERIALKMHQNNGGHKGYRKANDSNEDGKRIQKGVKRRKILGVTECVN